MMMIMCISSDEAAKNVLIFILLMGHVSSFIPAVDCGQYLHLNLFLSPFAIIRNGILHSLESLLEAFALLKKGD